MNELTVLSPAKLNLALRILHIREDGYHEIESILQKISLYDEIILQITSHPSISVTVDDPSIPTDEKNLAYQAAQLLLRSQNIKTGVAIHIKKRIPAENLPGTKKPG